MELRQLDYIYYDAHNRWETGRQFRTGEPGGMLVAIAHLARWTERLASAIERWARRPARAERMPGIPAR